jgi:hypothetical protein
MTAKQLVVSALLRAYPVGVVAMAAITAISVWNIVAPQPYGTGWTALLVPSAKTLPNVLVAPLGADVYLLALGAFGCWWALSRGVGPARAGLAATRVSFLAGLPILVAGVLMMTGMLGLLVVTPGDVPTTYRDSR